MLWVFSLLSLILSAGIRQFVYIKPSLLSWFRTHMTSADILPVSEQWEYTSVDKRRFIGNRMWKPYHPQMSFYPVLTTQIFTHSKIIWRIQFAYWTCSNSPSYSLNVKVISSFCILEPIQLVVHVTKSRAVKCHFPLCSWWRAGNGDIWERLDRVNASALSVASPRGKEL